MAQSVPCDPSPPLCDEASVDAERATLLHRWAAAKVITPEPGRIGDSLQLRVDGTLALHMVARRHFSVDEVVLKERPLINLPDPSPTVLRRVEQRYGGRSVFMNPALGVDWPNVSEEVRQACLRLFWAHPLMTSESDALLRESAPACEDLLQWFEPMRGRFKDGEELMRFLHIIDLNIHKDEESSGNSGFAGLFVLGSKFSHSCAPNSGWGFSPDGCLEYRAIRAIAPGDLLTFSYVGNGMNLLSSTIQRRLRLASLWFVCSCARCLAPDLARRLPCPRCGAPACLPQEAEDKAVPDWGGDRPLRDLVPDASAWRCTSCGEISPAAQLPLREEEELTRLVPQAMQRGPSNPGGAMVAGAKLRERASQEVGTQHWTYSLITFAWLQRCFDVLREEPLIVGMPEAALRSASIELARWLEVAAPQNVEQRLAALFLALRLESNLGGGLDEWGYDPVDPLGDGGTALKRLVEHGWTGGGHSTAATEPASKRVMVEYSTPPAPRWCGEWR